MSSNLSKGSLGPFRLAMITVAAIISLRNLPLAAEYGLASIFYFTLAAITFFLPISLVTAELATAYPQAGGNYTWVGAAFGKRWGFVALWSAWMESIAWFPAILAFSAAMLAHTLEPMAVSLVDNKLFYFVVMLIVLWGATFINFYGIETASWLSTLGVVAGTIIPGALIIALGGYWVISGKPLQFNWQWHAVLPEFKLDNMVLFAGILLGWAGIEVAAFHIAEIKQPKRNYPRSIVLASTIILILSILGTLAIAAVVPQQEINLLSGLIQAFQVFFKHFNIATWVPLIAALALIGALAGINAWTAGPAKGLLVAAQDNFLPFILTKTNKRGVPIAMLILQAIISTALSLIFLHLDDTSMAFWILTALSAQFTVFQYTLVFLAALCLRFKHGPNLHGFVVPGGKVGLTIICIVGLVACLFGFFIVFVAPTQLKTGLTSEYQLMLLISFLALILPAYFFTQIRKR